MLYLEPDHSDVYRNVGEGHHVIRHSERYWACLSTYLIIEQVLMHSVKSFLVGLTHGGGSLKALEHRVVAVNARDCSEINFAMQTL